jgi:hypothetical protein
VLLLRVVGRLDGSIVLATDATEGFESDDDEEDLRGVRSVSSAMSGKFPKRVVAG